MSHFSDELKEVYKNIFAENSTIEDKKKAHTKLQVWKIRTGQDTQAGILCTLIILNVHIKDVSGQITDPFTLSTLYASSFTKFINYATSFQLSQSTMYRSAQKLGIESFLIDLRHLCAHGKVMPSVEVFRKSMKICFRWIHNFYWKKELENVSDSFSNNMGRDMEFIVNLQEIFSLYDSMIELVHNNVPNINEGGKTRIGKEKLAKLENFMRIIKKERFFPAMKMLSKSFSKIIESKEMSQNSDAFFHEMLENCQYFMSTTAEDNQSFAVNETTCGEDDLNSSQDSNPKPARKRRRESIVNLYRDFVWQIARQGHLKMFIDKLHIVNARENEDPMRRSSAGFWICVILNSFQYYQKYLQFCKHSWTAPLKITAEVKKIYSYQFDADLRKTFIFVGTQMPPTLMRYSQGFLHQLIRDSAEENVDVCLSVLPYVQPPLSTDQLSHFRELIELRMRNNNETKPINTQKIYTLEDLIENGEQSMDIDSDNVEVIWQASLDDIDWKTQPIGIDVSNIQD